jgi:purine nucleoside phosphorylase
MPGRLAFVLGSGVGVPDVAGAAGWDPEGAWRRVVVPASAVDGEQPRAEAAVEVFETDEAVWLPRHGRIGGVVAPRVDHMANLLALVSLGCDRVVGVASCGSLRPDWSVGTVVVPDDVFAPWSTPSRFTDARGHRVPGFDRSWRRHLVQGWRTATATPVVDAGTYVETTGPRFETRAEVRFLSTVGDVVGMTIASECFLAGEVGLPHAALCVVDNLGNGVTGEPLTLDEYRAGVAANRTRLASDLVAVARELAA